MLSNKDPYNVLLFICLIDKKYWLLRIIHTLAIINANHYKMAILNRCRLLPQIVSPTRDVLTSKTLKISMYDIIINDKKIEFLYLLILYHLSRTSSHQKAQ